MKFWTWAQLSKKIEVDMGIEDEIFVTPEELLGYANEGIDDLEKKIHTLCEDYFITRSPSIPVIAGQEEISLPSDIYAMKIREVVFVDGTNSYPVRQLKSWRRFSSYETDKANSVTSNMTYHYFILNSVAGSPKLIITPTPSGGGVLKLWYLRNANELVNGDSILDIPEAATYIIKYCKVKIMTKELHPLLEVARAELDECLNNLIADLSEMFPNNENELEADYAFYRDSL